MTVAKKMLYLSSAVLLAGAMGVAQTAMGSSQDQDSSAASQAAGAKVRGCLSGSEGNYTLTDNNGTIYHLVGGDAQLSGSVGHEVEISGTPDAQRSSASDDTAANTASSFQVTGAREVGTRCEHGSATGTMGTNSQPMTERPPTTDRQPKGAPGEGTPPPEPQPHIMAMLQQPGATDMGSQSGTNQTTSSPSSTSQSPDNGAMANTPVTNQTPAEPASPTGANSQLGSGTTNPSAVSTQPAQTGTPTTPQAGTATTPETGASTMPQAGTTNTTGSNPAAGENNANTGVGATPGATTSTNPDMNANPGAAANPGATATPQSTQNDQNKPLYERQATDVPWANHSGANTGATTTTTSTNPDGSSTTTTTTNPKSQTSPQSPTSTQPQSTPEPH